ncbi:hypothetical protein [Rhodococcus koreensis]
MTIFLVILAVLLIPVAAYLIKGGSSGGRYTQDRGYRSADDRAFTHGVVGGDPGSGDCGNGGGGGDSSSCT